MACVERALGAKVARPKRSVGCPPHLLAWHFSARLLALVDHDEHDRGAPCCTATAMHGKQCRADLGGTCPIGKQHLTRKLSQTAAARN